MITSTAAKQALEHVASGETTAIDGWLAYGVALNEGRSLFPSDEQFGQWALDAGLSQLGTHEIKRDDRAAAMWDGKREASDHLPLRSEAARIAAD